MNPLASKGTRLLEEIRSEALDPESDLASTLRKCVALGGESGSERLREWAVRELKGYPTDDDVPEYRRVSAPLSINWRNSAWHATGETISPSMLPEAARKFVDDQVPVGFSVAAIEDMLRTSAGKDRSAIKLMHPKAPAIVQLMNETIVEGGTVTELYWSVNRSYVQEILDVVRTILVELVSEIQAAYEGTQTGSPSRELVESAVSVAIYGDNNRLSVGSTIRASGDVTAGEVSTVAQSNMVASPRPGLLRKLAWWIFGLAGLAAAVATIVGFFVL